MLLYGLPFAFLFTVKLLECRFAIFTFINILIPSAKNTTLQKKDIFNLNHEKKESIRWSSGAIQLSTIS